MLKVGGRLAKGAWAERLMVERLVAMSDRELRDIGIVRSQIERAARRGIDRGRIRDHGA